MTYGFPPMRPGGNAGLTGSAAPAKGGLNPFNNPGGGGSPSGNG